MNPTLSWDGTLGVEYVEVADEPRHVEVFRNERLRAYLATIDPGTATLYHRHRLDTLYVAVSGGLSRSDEPGRQRQHTLLGRSVRPSGKLALGLRRAVLGTVRLPTGTVLMQYHRDFPLTHRLRASGRNTGPIRMLGVEFAPEPAGPPRTPATLPGLAVEYRDAHATTYRIRPVPGRSTVRVHSGFPALLVVVDSGAVRWLSGDGGFTVENPASAPLDALLIVPN